MAAPGRTPVGGYTPDTREADDEAARRSRVFVDCLESAFDGVGDILAPIKSGAIRREDVRGDLYDLIGGGVPGRLGPDDITFFKNAGGGHLDLMTAQAIMAALDDGLSRGDLDERSEAWRGRWSRAVSTCASPTPAPRDALRGRARQGGRHPLRPRLFEGVVTGAADGYWRMADKPAATLLHLGPGTATASPISTTRKAASGIVNIVGEHATYHVKATLTSDIRASRARCRRGCASPSPCGRSRRRRRHRGRAHAPGQVAT